MPRRAGHLHDAHRGYALDPYTADGGRASPSRRLAVGHRLDPAGQLSAKAWTSTWHVEIGPSRRVATARSSPKLGSVTRTPSIRRYATGTNRRRRARLPGSRRIHRASVGGQRHSAKSSRSSAPSTSVVRLNKRCEGKNRGSDDDARVVGRVIMCAQSPPSACRRTGLRYHGELRRKKVAERLRRLETCYIAAACHMPSTSVRHDRIVIDRRRWLSIPRVGPPVNPEGEGEAP